MSRETTAKAPLDYHLRNQDYRTLNRLYNLAQDYGALFIFVPHPSTFKHCTVAAESKDLYIIPAKFRKIENLHILFWLVKDLCWCLAFKPLGIIMIIPTLLVAVWIAWRTRHIVAELAHNVAIAIWIMANSMWMISEFWGVDEQVKPYCLIPFSLGILILLYYYLIYVPLQKRKDNAAAAINANALAVPAPQLQEVTAENK